MESQEMKQATVADLRQETEKLLYGAFEETQWADSALAARDGPEHLFKLAEALFKLHDASEAMHERLKRVEDTLTRRP